MIRTATLAAVILSIGLGSSAMAHPKLTTANPPAQGKAAVSPKTLRLTFNEPVMPNFSGVVIKNARGQAIKTSRPRVDPSDNKTLIVPLARALPRGLYHVAWHAVSTDTHRVSGQYDFTIG